MQMHEQEEGGVGARMSVFQRRWVLGTVWRPATGAFSYTNRMQQWRLRWEAGRQGLPCDCRTQPAAGRCILIAVACYPHSML